MPFCHDAAANCVMLRARQAFSCRYQCLDPRPLSPQKQIAFLPVVLAPLARCFLSQTCYCCLLAASMWRQCCK